MAKEDKKEEVKEEAPKKEPTPEPKKEETTDKRPIVDTPNGPMYCNPDGSLSGLNDRRKE
jgi:hypothetical protein|tara:strand:+ start:73 stop:252 length:180 start_codon:yes stop_codon:yes gene_type:complete